MRSEPVVEVTGGAIRGCILSQGGLCFAAIPFAAPPLDALRFRPPQPLLIISGEVGVPRYFSL